MNKLFSKNQKGVGLIEVLLAISMAGIIIVSVGQSLSSMHKLTARSEINDKALAYAKQSMEIIIEIKNNNFFTDFTSDTNYQAADPGLAPNSFYTRDEICQDADGNVLLNCIDQAPYSEKITVTVIINYDGTKRAELSTIFTNWRQQTP